MTSSAMLFTALLLSGPLQVTGTTGLAGRPAVARSGDVIRVPETNAVVKQKDHVLIPAREAGLLQELLVREMQTVEPGQLVGRLDSDAARARRQSAVLELELARAQASSDAEIRAAEVTAGVAEKEVEELKAINSDEPGTIPETQIRRGQLQYDRATLQAEVARHEQRLANIQSYVKASAVEEADLLIQRHELRATTPGVIVKVNRKAGEWLQAGDPVAEVVNMDVLRLHITLDIKVVAPHEVLGRSCTVRVRLTDGEAEYIATIDAIDPLINETAGVYRVFADLQNRPHPLVPELWEIQPGMRASVEIDLGSPRTAPPAGFAPAAGFGPADGIGPDPGVGPAAPPVDLAPPVDPAAPVAPAPAEQFPFGGSQIVPPR